jgi:reverse gyrase
MTPDSLDLSVPLSGKVDALRQVLGTELGEPAPLEGYRRLLSEESAQHFEEQLDEVERAQADAAARLPTLYAD